MPSSRVIKGLFACAICIVLQLSVMFGKKRQMMMGMIATAPPMKGSLSRPLAQPLNASSPLPRPTNGTMYSWARNDRSGATIMDMLLAHGYAFANNLQYAGACPGKPRRFARNKPKHLELIHQLGFDDVLHFSCPVNKTSVVDDTHYQIPNFNTKDWWTPEWLSYMRSLQKRQFTYASNSEKKQVAIHIRRGDVQLCASQGLRDRYIPNAFYLESLSEYFGSNEYNTTIYSESDSFEDWNDFQVNLALDTPVSTVWEALMTADVAVVARSSFSLVPVLFNRHGIIIYPMYMYKPLEHFQVVTNESLRFIEDEKDRLEQSHCLGKGGQRLSFGQR